MYVDYKELGQRIAKRRKELGLKQYQVNELAGLSEKYLSNIERATSIPSLDVLMKLCTVLKITPNELLLGATTSAENGELDKAVLASMSAMTPTQKKIAFNMLNWISNQNFD